ncbi:TetR family transcriptional regulator [Consotaella salsifontis]|uniref:Transcriptional regulator, TetR family n=1 Tax=Consotaella salsifontis TaxID=1365950 RepID=A0A1T4T7K1_9HYPH|nr:TetR family transcriptional regulator [Consotaella salsifontis]SKA36319.1 transcriptional regulator, TetR family [Consotaella salsifontis]
MRRTKQEAEETRSAIIDAAEKVFYEKGVAATSLAEVASAASVTRGAIYWHFDNKLDLFRAMQDRVCLPQEQLLQVRDVLSSDDVLGGLHATTLDALVRIKDDEHARLVYSIILFRCEYVGEMQDALMRRNEAEQCLEGLVVASFEKAMANGQLAAGWTPTIAARAFFCCIGGLLTEWLRCNADFDLVETGTAILESLFAGFALQMKNHETCVKRCVSR